MSELYHDSRDTNWKVGFVTVLCLAILIFGYGWLRQWADHKNHTSFTVWFANANGIEPGDDVTLNGVKVGRVERLEVTADGVLITLKAQLPEPLRQGTVFKLKESNLMGDKIVEIIPGRDDSMLAFDPPPRGGVQTGLSGFIAGLDSLVESIENLLNGLEQESGLMASIQGAADSTRALMGTLNDAVKKNRPAIDAAIADLAESTRRVSHMLREDGAVDQTVQSMPELSEKARAALEQLDVAAGELEKLAADVRTGDGTAGKLIGDDELHERLLRVTSRVDSLITDIKRDPKKYFEVKVF